MLELAKFFPRNEGTSEKHWIGAAVAAGSPDWRQCLFRPLTSMVSSPLVKEQSGRNSRSLGLLDGSLVNDAVHSASSPRALFNISEDVESAKVSNMMKQE